MSSPSERLAVCSWSLQPTNPRELIARLAQTGVRQVQLALDPLREQPGVWGEAPQMLSDEGLGVVSGMFGTVGEDYSTLDTIRRTGGIVPEATWEANWRNIQGTAALADRLGLSLVTFHAGFLPHEPADSAAVRLAARVRQVAECFGAHGVELGLETGQETAETLDAFLQSLDCPQVGVNFDPANLILYDKGDPVAALRRLGRWLKQVHIKDACRTRVPGTWGEEKVVGTGEVDWRGFFAVLRELSFDGHLCIEREAGSQRIADIRAAAEFVGHLE